MILTLPLLIAFSAAVLATSFLSGVFGMAGGMLLMGLLLLMLPVPAAMVLHGITQMASNGWRAWLWRQHIDYRIVLQYAAGGLTALALFTLVRLVPSKPAVLIFLGLMPILNKWMPAKLAPSIERPGGGLVCGFVCTALQLIAGVSGPILDIFFVNTGLDRRRVVATKALSQTFGHSLKLVYFGGIVASAESAIDVEVGVLAVSIALIGTTLSRRLLEGMTDNQFRNWSQILIMGMGVAYLAQGLWLLAAV